MNYVKTVWQDLPDRTTPITASRLNNLETQYEKAEQAFPSKQDAFTAGLRWVAFGDSLTSEAGGGAPDMGWPVQTGMLSDGQIVPFRNAGIVGNNASDMLARIDADVLAYSPNFVTVWVGTNDVTQSRTLAAYQADVTAIIETLRSNGATPVLFTIPPRADTTKYTTINAWNAWLRDYAQRERVSLIDAYAVLVDPATGAYKSGYDSGDGIHISLTGHNALAAEFVAEMSSRLPSGGVLRPRYNLDANNLITNGLLLDNDDASPGVPDGWLVSGTATGHTEALVDDADFFGGKAWEVASVTPTSFRQFARDAEAGWAVGDVLLFVAKVKVVSSSGVGASKGVRINANFFGADSPTQVLGRYIRLSGLQGIIAKRFTVPVGTTGPVQVAVVFDYEDTASQTARVGEFGVYNLTQLGLV